MQEQRVIELVAGHAPESYFEVHLPGGGTVVGRLDMSVPTPVVDGILMLKYVARPQAADRRIFVSVEHITAIVEL